MEDHSIPNKNLGGSVRGKWPVGKPHSRWKDNIKKDAFDMLHIWNWKSVAQIRQKWRKNTGVAMN